MHLAWSLFIVMQTGTAQVPIVYCENEYHKQFFVDGPRADQVVCPAGTTKHAAVPVVADGAAQTITIPAAPPTINGCHIERYVFNGATIGMPPSDGWHEAGDLRIVCEKAPVADGAETVKPGWEDGTIIGCSGCSGAVTLRLPQVETVKPQQTIVHGAAIPRTATAIHVPPQKVISGDCTDPKQDVCRNGDTVNPLIVKGKKLWCYGPVNNQECIREPDGMLVRPSGEPILCTPSTCFGAETVKPQICHGAKFGSWDCKNGVPVPPEEVDVPAIQRTHEEEYDDYNWCNSCSDSACTSMACDPHAKHKVTVWTCSDSHRILEHTEAGEYWCRKVQP